MDVLEHHDRGPLGRQALEEGAPGREERLAPAGRWRLQAQQRQQRLLDPVAVIVGDELRHGLVDPLARRGLVVVLGETRTATDHLAEGPEGDAVAVAGGAAAVPVDLLDQTIDVLLELPREPALADARRAGDGDEARPLLLADLVQQVLEQAQLHLSTDERRLQALAPTAATAVTHDAQGAPGSDGRFLSRGAPVRRPPRRRWHPTRPASWPRRRARCPAERRPADERRC